MDYCSLNFFRWRLKLGLTQVEAAEVLGIGERRVSDYENGRAEPPMGTQYLMTRLLWDAAAGLPLYTTPWCYMQPKEVEAAEMAAVRHRKILLSGEVPFNRQKLRADHRQNPPAEEIAGLDQQKVRAAENSGHGQKILPPENMSGPPAGTSGAQKAILGGWRSFFSTGAGG
jgi:transcriptional regulator with XRE-family HTH domain